MEKLNRNYYDLLNITRDADGDAVKKAFRKAALEHHPDKGGTDQMFQAVKEAYDTLSDPIKKRNYDRDLKKYGVRDGLKKTKTGFNDTAKAKTGFKKGYSTTNMQEETKAGKKPPSEGPKKAPFVEIPASLKTLSIKELKKLLVDLGLKHDDCFEKQDMINRVQEFKDNRKGGGADKSYGRSTTEAPRKAPRPSSGMKRNASNAASSTGFSGTMGTEEPVSFKILSIGNQEVGKS